MIVKSICALCLTLLTLLGGTGQVWAEASNDSDAAKVRAVVEAIFKDIQDGDLQAVADYHLDSEAFSKWPDDGTPALLNHDQTVDAETAMFSAMSAFEYELRGLRADVMGDVAIATFVIAYKVTFGEDTIEAAERGSLVFTVRDGEWKIVHEHFSPATS